MVETTIEKICVDERMDKGGKWKGGREEKGMGIVSWSG